MALWRLLVLGAAVGVAFALVSRGGLSTGRLREAIEPAGAWAPLAFVAAGALLTLALFPGPVMAGAAGLLFGPALGTAVAIATSTLGATLAFLVSRHVAREQVEQALGSRFAGLRGWVARRGFWAVAASRVAPGLPNNALSYAFGLMSLPVLAFSAGIALGWGPKAFAYATLGGSLSNLDSTEAIVAVAVLALMGVVGVTIVARDIRAARARAADPPVG